jgi:menaquinone-dependent protoporphyrinogen oxidase
MAERRLLIVFGTSHGQTEKIARRMADVLTGSGDAVTLWNADALPPDDTPRDVDGIIVGAPVLFGQHRSSVVRFVRRHIWALNATPSAFFSVSGSAASPQEPARREARRILDEFLRETGWRPLQTATIAGAMAYTKYNPVLRWIIRRISVKEGGPTDTTRDHEYTDWVQVESFAREFAERLAEEAARAAVP